MAGVDLRTVQELLGHKVPMTIRYAHLAPKHTLAAWNDLTYTQKSLVTPLLTPSHPSHSQSSRSELRQVLRFVRFVLPCARVAEWQTLRT